MTRRRRGTAPWDLSHTRRKKEVTRSPKWGSLSAVILPPRRVAPHTDGAGGYPTVMTVLTNPVPCFRTSRRTGRWSDTRGTGAVSRFKLLLCRAGSSKIFSSARQSVRLSRESTAISIIQLLLDQRIERDRSPLRNKHLFKRITFWRTSWLWRPRFWCWWSH